MGEREDSEPVVGVANQRLLKTNSQHIPSKRETSKHRAAPGGLENRKRQDGKETGNLEGFSL